MSIPEGAGMASIDIGALHEWLKSTLSIAALIVAFLDVRSIPNRSSSTLLISRFVTVFKSADCKISPTLRSRSASLGIPGP